MALSPSDNPPQSNATDPTTGTPSIPYTVWCVVNTLPSREKTLAHILSNTASPLSDIPYLLPMAAIRNPRTRKTTYRLLFPGIIFIGAPTHTNLVQPDPTLPYPYNREDPSNRSYDPRLLSREHARRVLQPTLDRLLTTRHIHSFLHTGLQERFNRELRLLASQTPAQRTNLTDPPPLAIAQAVRICRGPFLGLEGTVEKLLPEDPTHPHDTPTRVHILLHLLGKTISVEISNEDLEPITP